MNVSCKNCDEFVGKYMITKSKHLDIKDVSIYIDFYSIKSFIPFDTQSIIEDKI